MKKTALILMLSMCSVFAMYAEGAEDSFVEGIFKYEIDGVHGTGDSVKVSVVQDSINTDFHLPDSVLHIPASVVHGGRQYGVRAIKRGGLFGCSCIKKLIIDEGIRIVEEHAFALCPNLQSIDFPSTIDSIGCGLFNYSEHLREIRVDEKNPKFDSRDNCNAVIRTKSNCLLAGCRATVIPSSVAKIDYRSFEGCIGLKNVRIPEGVKEIDGRAYSECPDLESVHISSTVEEICGYAFCQCPNFRQITVDGKNPKFDSRKGCNAIIRTSNDRLIVGSVDAVIPNGVREIGDYAFYDIPVKHIAIPKSVDSISTTAFINRPSCVTSIQVDKGNPVYDSRDNCNAIIKTASNTLCLGCDRTQIPGSVQAIGDNAFTGTDIGATLILPEGVEEIGDRAFASCRFLNYIVLPRSIKRIAFSAFPSKKLQPIFKQDATKVEIFKIYSDTSPSLIPLLEAQEKREKERKKGNK